jgi:hypothetical protein
MMSHRKPNGIGLMGAILARAIDPSIDTELLMRITLCSLCAKGHQPEDGYHVILGAHIPCEAAEHLASDPPEGGDA